MLLLVLQDSGHDHAWAAQKPKKLSHTNYTRELASVSDIAAIRTLTSSLPDLQMRGILPNKDHVALNGGMLKRCRKCESAKAAALRLGIARARQPTEELPPARPVATLQQEDVRPTKARCLIVLNRLESFRSVVFVKVSRGQCRLHASERKPMFCSLYLNCHDLEQPPPEAAESTGVSTAPAKRRPWLLTGIKFGVDGG